MSSIHVGAFLNICHVLHIFNFCTRTNPRPKFCFTDPQCHRNIQKSSNGTLTCSRWSENWHPLLKLLKKKAELCWLCLGSDTLVDKLIWRAGFGFMQTYSSAFCAKNYSAHGSMNSNRSEHKRRARYLGKSVHHIVYHWTSSERRTITIIWCSALLQQIYRTDDAEDRECMWISDYKYLSRNNNVIYMRRFFSTSLFFVNIDYFSINSNAMIARKKPNIIPSSDSVCDFWCVCVSLFFNVLEMYFLGEGRKGLWGF